MAIVDLSQLYPTTEATVTAKSITGHSLEANQAEDLWMQVSAFCNAESLLLKYRIPDLTWQDNPPVETS